MDSTVPAGPAGPGPDPRQRLFLAVGIDEETKHVIGSHLREHLPGSMPGRVVPAANWHLTLRFLGWATAEQRDRIMHDVADSVTTKPFTVRFGSLGAFPKPRRSTVLWLGIDSGHEELAELAEVCEEAAQDTGFAPEDRPYHAHLTLSRIRPPIDAGGVIEQVPPCPVKMRVTELRLYESHLQRGGAIYQAVDTIDL